MERIEKHPDESWIGRLIDIAFFERRWNQPQSDGTDGNRVARVMSGLHMEVQAEATYARLGAK